MTDDTAPIIVELVPLAAPVPTPSAPLGEMVYRPDSWTPQEVRTLRQLFNDDTPLPEISEALGRGPARCQGQGLHPWPAPPFNAAVG